MDDILVNQMVSGESPGLHPIREYSTLPIYATVQYFCSVQVCHERLSFGWIYCCKKYNICKKPENGSFETAATILTGGTTAIYLLNISKLKAVDDILINGASGGVWLHYNRQK